MSDELKLAVAQLNLVVGDLAGNLAQMQDAAAQAHADGVDLLLFPELSLCGYCPEDLLLSPEFREQLSRAEDELRASLPEGLAILYGAPEYGEEGLFNVARLIDGGRPLASYRKRCLPNYGVFDEQRWFQAGESACVVEFRGIRLGLTVCEDLWRPGPAASCADAGAELIVSISASPYARDKASERDWNFRQRWQECGLPMVVCNLLGGQDEVVFDGNSLALDGNGEVVMRAPEWEAGLFTVAVRREGGRLALASETRAPILSTDESQYRGAVLATRDYLGKNGVRRALVGLSGGIDSALTLAVAGDALGAENVTAVMMASRYTRDISFQCAREQARLMGVDYLELPIDEGVAAVTGIIDSGTGEALSGVAAENIQARLRGAMLMSLSNRDGGMVLATGNKSELAMGYATLYGDMVGAFAPLKDLTKTRVYALSRWRNEQGKVMPEAVIDRPPSAELRADQYDSDSLPDYAELDAIIEAFVEADCSAEAIIQAGHDAATVHRVLVMVQASEYKRRQGAPGPRLSRRAFGRDRRYPIVSRFRR
ncbi:NAD+ synthase [Natronospira bacteriovora]|uniref:Glutamine-dependent NAD(+) synthetase n=1 Tax=Natronospira bacteriovora TaxID=3069753 RepID=A0ABU0W8Q0_9GAMM|nr:NAD+ synthase [Natronospira sp. AB-CW4]MDQ2070421.1 NAD+ synthase [Natronospira sp. AB-CW4]